MIGCFILLSVGLAAANPIGFELLKDHLFKKNKQQPVYVTGQQYYQQSAPDLTYGPPELPGTNPQGPTTTIVGTTVGTGAGPQYPTWQWPQKHIFQKPYATWQYPQKEIIQRPVQVYQPVVQVKPFHIPKPQYVPVIKPFPIYKPEIVHVPINKPAKPTFDEIKSGFVSKIEGIKSDIADKIAGKIAGVKAVADGIKSGIGSKVTGIKSDISGKVTAFNDKVTGIKTDISDKVTGIKSGIYSGIADKVTGVKQTVHGIKSTVADGITDKIVGLKVIGAHIGDEVKEIGTAVGSALKVVKNDFYNKKHHQPQYVLVPARPQPQGPIYTYVQHPHTQVNVHQPHVPTVNVNPPSLTYGPPELN